MKPLLHPVKRSAVVLGLVFALISCWSAWAADAEHITLQYDSVGNVTSQTNPRWSSNYTYDVLDRLKTETGVATQTFGYDANGNRNSDGGGSYGYGTQSNRLLTRYGTSFTYDNAGRVTGDGSYTYVYNAGGQVKQVKQGATVVATYYYDYRSRRRRKVTASATTVYHYDQSDHLVGESSGAGVAQKTYVYRDDTPVAQLDQGSSLTVTYLHTDQLGTPRSGRDDAGNVVWRWDSDAFGTTAANEDPDGNQQARVINLRFPGQYKDAETGLHYNHHRYYAAGLGRYLQSDPIGLAGGFNLYAYAYGDPLRFTDPKGTVPPLLGPILCMAAAYEAADFAMSLAIAANNAGTNAIASQMNAERRNRCAKQDPLTPGACDFVQDLQGLPVEGAMNAAKDGIGMPGTISGGIPDTFHKEVPIR